MLARKRGDLWSPLRSPDASVASGRRTDKKIRPFQLKRKITAGEISKMNQGTVFSGGAQRVLVTR